MLILHAFFCEVFVWSLKKFCYFKENKIVFKENKNYFKENKSVKLLLLCSHIIIKVIVLNKNCMTSVSIDGKCFINIFSVDFYMKLHDRQILIHHGKLGGILYSGS